MPITSTDFHFPGQRSVFHGKVRDVYNINDDLLAIVATDRISAFDVILPRPIPHKGQVLNQIAAYFLDATAQTVPNWKVTVPDPNVTIGLRCQPYPVEMIIRGYLAGSAWRAYQKGQRRFGHLTLPEGMKENQRLPEPVITPTTKAAEGHDLDITAEEIVVQGLVPAHEYAVIEQYTRQLFEIGQRMASDRGLILVDTKYEFGQRQGKVMLIDEVHTPDSSRYFYADGYEERLSAGVPQRQLSKEFVRQWLIDNGFMGQPGQQVPEMTPQVVADIADRYIELYQTITGLTFEPADDHDPAQRIETNVLDALTQINL